MVLIAILHFSFVAGELKSLSLPRGFPPELTVKENDKGKETNARSLLIRKFASRFPNSPVGTTINIIRLFLENASMRFLDNRG